MTTRVPLQDREYDTQSYYRDQVAEDRLQGAAAISGGRAPRRTGLEMLADASDAERNQLADFYTFAQTTDYLGYRRSQDPPPDYYDARQPVPREKDLNL